MSRTTEDGGRRTADRGLTPAVGRTVLGEPRLGGDASPYQAQPIARRSRIWLWIVAAFAIQLAVWAAWIIFASHHRVAEVPLATASDRR